MRTKELRIERAKLIADARALLDAPDATAETVARANAMLDESDAIKGRVDLIERAEADAAALAQPAEVVTVTGATQTVSADDRQNSKARERRILRALLLGSGADLNASEREDYAHRLNTFRPAASGSTGTGGGGGYTIAPDFQHEVLIALKAFGGMRGAARSITTATGADLPWPTMDDTSNSAFIVGENTQLPAATDLAFGQAVMKGFTYSSNVLTISLQLLQDSAFDFDQMIRDAIAIRLARRQNNDFTVGDGNGKPRGVMVDAVLGATGTTGSETATVTFDNLLDLEHSVDPAYRADARWMFHDSTLRVLRGIKDSYGRYLWEPGVGAGAPDTIWNYPYTINQDMPVMAAGAKSILFGDLSHYLIRDILGMQMMVLRERYADFLQVGYIAFMRTDGRVITAGQPLKFYQNAAT